jgi:hypothetical protein
VIALVTVWVGAFVFSLVFPRTPSDSSRVESATEEPGRVVRHQIWNALQMDPDRAAVAKRYGRSMEELTAIEAEGARLHWADPNPGGNADPDWNVRLRTIVTSVGQSCPSVTTAFHQGIDPKTHMNFWNVRCVGGDTYAVGMLAGERRRILDCRTLKTVSGVECFKTFDDQNSRTR